MSDSPVFDMNNEDPAMQRAYAMARQTFRYFWRELSWEYRRIVPGLGMAAVKAPFSDGGIGPNQQQAEQMWCCDVGFDGRTITATLMNQPNWVRSVSEGDEVQLTLNQITDWLYAMGDRAYGAFTVHAIRAQMPPHERAEHDQMWGLEFGDPNNILVVPADHANSLQGDHPMSVNMGDSLREHVMSDPQNALAADENGFTMLHSLALAGSITGVQVLLSCGANPNVVTNHGMTPMQLAQSLGWDQVVNLLVQGGARG